MGNTQSHTKPENGYFFQPKPREMSITDRVNEFIAFLAKNKTGINSGLQMADFLIRSFGNSNPYTKTLSSLIKCLSGLLLKLNVEKVEGKSSEDQTKDRNLMKTIRAEIMLDLNKLKENLPLFQNLNIPCKLVGRIMGSGGDIINNIQKESGASIKVQKRGEDLYENVMVKGEKDAVEKAVNLIVDKIENQKVKTQMIIWIPKEKVGKLMGKQGEAIKIICEESKACIQVEERKLLDEGNERYIKITGNPLAVSTARQRIEDRIGFGCVRNQESVLMSYQVKLVETYRKELNMIEEADDIEKDIIKAMKSFNILSINKN